METRYDLEKYSGANNSFELAVIPDYLLIDQAITHTGEIIYGTIYAIIHVISTYGNLI